MRTALLLLLPIACGASGPQRFDLGAPAFEKAVPYSAERGHGFEPGAPKLYSVRVPEGNYRVRLALKPDAGKQTRRPAVFAEQRQLMAEPMFKRRPIEITFLVNVRAANLPALPANATGGTRVALKPRELGSATWDDKLTLEFTGTNPAVQTIQIQPSTVPTIFIMGDSTVTDQPRDPGASWGQMLPVFFKDTVAVANHATSGETMKSSITGLRLDKVLAQAKRGDYLLIQYGHNDEKQSWPQTYVEPETTFKAYLNVFIAEARRRGVTPVIISPMERRTGTTPEANSHGSFPKAYAEVAAEQKVAFIDLWAKSKIMYAAMGNDVGAAFNDATHHKTYGAYELAKIVATSLRQNNLDLAKELKDDFKDFDPAHPDAAGSFTIPFNIALSGRPPQGN